MKILIAGGGTGGHVYPGLAVGNELKRRHPEAQIEFAGRKTAAEGHIIPNAGYKLNQINVLGFERFASFTEKTKVAFLLLRGMYDAFSLIHRFKPDLVIGSGGFVCGPVVLAASRSHIPTLIMEQNIRPGITNKLLSGCADTVCTTFEESKAFMKHPEKCVNTGNPVRGEFALYERDQSHKLLGIENGKTVVLSFGGSQGAESINKAVAEMICDMQNDRGKYFIHITGDDNYTSFLEKINPFVDKASSCDNIKILSYADNMPVLIKAADIIISRSGATSIAEINYSSRCAIYVPYPQAAEDHQAKNAMSIQRSGAARMILDKDLTGESLAAMVKFLCDNPDMRKKMEEKAGELANPNATNDICDLAEKLLKK